MKVFFKNHQKAFDFIGKKILKKHRGYFFWTLFSLFVSSAIGVFLPYLAKLEIDQLVAKNSTLFSLSFSSPIVLFGTILFVVFLAELLESFLSFLFGLKTRIQKSILEFELKKEIFSRIYTIDPGYTMMDRFRRMMSGVSMVVNDIPNNIERITSGYFGVILEVSAIGFVASFFDWKIFIVIFFASFVNYGINQFSEYYRRKHELSDRYELEWEMRTIDYAVEESYHHIASNGATKMLFDRFFTLKRQQIASVVKGEKIDFITRIAEQASNGSATICVKLLVGFLIFAGTGSIGLMTLVTLYMGRITRLTSQFFQTFSDRYEMIENIAILQFFLDFIDEKSKSRTNILTEAPKKIITKDLNFSYPKPAKAEVDFLDIKIATLKRILKERNDNHHLDELHAYEESRKEAIKENPTIIHDMNLAFEKGKIYGIVGKNGAGKTTFVSLLLGFFSEYRGSILIDGIEFSSIERENIQKLIGYVSQEPFTMHGRFTVRDNLLLGVHRDISDEELYQYLDIFGMKEKIQKEREGLSTRLKWDMDLSGGQKQILALIRVILQDRPILILDEGTNQLDAENEMKVMNELLKNRKDKIIIFVTHRMNTMWKCDSLYTFVDGRIEDTGSPNELSLRDNAFRRFLDIGEQQFS